MPAFRGKVYGHNAVPTRQRPLVRTAQEASAYHTSHHHGRDALPEMGFGQLEDLRQDLPDVRRMIEGGQAVQALVHVAETIGVTPESLKDEILEPNAGAAGLVGWVQGVLDQEDFVRQVRNPAPARRTRRGGYGRI